MGLRIAILGTRGIPARYGGFETFAEEISKDLHSRGHSVTVYCRRKFFAPSGPDEYMGIALRYLPTIMQKYLETPLHGLTSMLDLFRCKYDVVLLCNAANSPFAWLARLRGFPIAINVDGIERKRTKWSALGRLWYRLGEYSSVKFATHVIADAKVIADYYLEKYRCPSRVIAYGANAIRREPGEMMAEFSLKPKGYILYVSRLEPENNALGVIKAYSKIKTEMPLVIVGDAPYSREYIALLKETGQGKNVIFTGFRFGAAYHEFQSNCYAYIQATEVGGTHPALIESMAYGNCVIANGTPENLEVLGDAGLFYQKNDFDQLAEQLAFVIAKPDEAQRFGLLARERAASLYTWAKIGSEYEALFSEMCGV